MVRRKFQYTETIFLSNTLSFKKGGGGDDKKTYQIFGVPVGNAKITKKVQFHPAAPVIKYHQKSSNSCCLGSLE